MPEKYGEWEAKREGSLEVKSAEEEVRQLKARAAEEVRQAERRVAAAKMKLRGTEGQKARMEKELEEGRRRLAEAGERLTVRRIRRKQRRESKRRRKERQAREREAAELRKRQEEEIKVSSASHNSRSVYFNRIKCFQILPDLNLNLTQN